MNAIANLRRDRITAQFTRYLLVGAANTAFSYGVYAVGLTAGMGFQVASLVALLAGIASGFVAQGRLTFMATLRGRFSRFCVVWAVLYLANISLIGLFVALGSNAYIAGLLAIIPIILIAFLLQRSFIFGERNSVGFADVVMLLIALIFIARLRLTYAFNLNWDEFLNLSMVFDYLRNDPLEVWQTLFVHFFSWVFLISPNEVEQLYAIRIVMLLMVLVSSIAIYGISRRFVGHEPALVGVLAFNAVRYSLLYGADFRTDTMATPVMLLAVWIVSCPKLSLRGAVCAGALCGIGGALTIKSVFFMPTVAALLLVRAFQSEDVRGALVRVGMSAFSAAVTLSALLAVHAWMLPRGTEVVQFITRTGTSTLLSGDYSIALSTLVKTTLFDFGFWIAVIAGAVTVFRREFPDRIAAATFLLPLAAFAVYRDIYPYYVPFLIGPLCVLVAIAASTLQPVWRNTLVALFAVGAIFAFGFSLNRPSEPQRQVVELVHRIFPEPVPYIDHTSMISAFPKKGIFMSNWGMTDYRREGRPIMTAILDEDAPRFLLQTHNRLAVDKFSPEQSEHAALGLLASDVQLLQSNYLRYWGPLFLPGKELRNGKALRILIPGRYRLKGSAVDIQGAGKLRPEQEIYLARGDYRVSLEGETDAWLVWAASAPPASAPPEALFVGW